MMMQTADLGNAHYVLLDEEGNAVNFSGDGAVTRDGSFGSTKDFTNKLSDDHHCYNRNDDADSRDNSPAYKVC